MSTGHAGKSGVSGSLSFSTGDATSRFDPNHSGHSGSISMNTGNAQGIGRGGSINLRVGTSTLADGDNVRIAAGEAKGASFIGGALHLTSGASDYISGDVNLESASTTRDTSYGGSGAINIRTGSSERSGSGALNIETGDGLKGSPIQIKAGKSSERATSGGGVLIQGGEGSYKGNPYGSGDGGDLHLIGGASNGRHLLNDRAGNVIIDGGKSSGNGIGGSIRLRSGHGSISGLIQLETLEASMTEHDSGVVAIKTGPVSSGKSGDVTIETGKAAQDKGRSGTISVRLLSFSFSTLPN